ncbi:MAG: glycosyltransferase family 9 protein, partial [Cyanobacteria bacterium P01_H01_bin.121]
MQPFTNQPLNTPAHLAVLGSSKVGNFVVITPLLRGLKAKYPACRLDYFGSDITQDFERHCSYIDWQLSITGDRPDFLQRLASQVQQRCQQVGPYDLAINCDEFNEVNRAVLQMLQPSYLAGTEMSLDRAGVP